MKEERFSHPGKSPHCRGDQPGWRGSFRALEESTATGVQKAKWTVMCTEGQHHHPVLPRLRRLSVSVGGGWVLKHRLQRSDPGRRLGLAAQTQPEEVGLWQLRVHSEQAWAHQRGKHLLGGAHKERGGTTIKIPFPMSAPRKQDTAYRNSRGGRK